MTTETGLHVLFLVKLDVVSLHSTNLNVFVLAPTVRICRVRSLKGKEKYQLPVAIFDVRPSTLSLL